MSRHRASAYYGQYAVAVASVGEASGKVLTSSAGNDRLVYPEKYPHDGQYYIILPPPGTAWSPDGTQLVFVSDRDGNAEIYVMNDDGGNQRRLTTEPAVDGYPSWSPDGSRIAFLSYRLGSGYPQLYSFKPDGTQLVRITGPARKMRYRLEYRAYATGICTRGTSSLFARPRRS